MMRDLAVITGPNRDTFRADAGLAEVRRLARELDPEPEHVFQVCRNAEGLFDATDAVHAMGKAERRLLLAAALLHDIGHTVDVVGHHKHSRDLILKMGLPGFTKAEQRIIACVARYHRKAHPLPAHGVYCDLDKRDRERVEKLAAILRIADGLDRSHEASCRRVSVSSNDAIVTINVEQRRPNATDIWGAQRKQGLFEEVLTMNNPNIQLRKSC